MAIEFGALTSTRPTIRETATQMRGANAGYPEHLSSASTGFSPKVDYNNEAAKGIVQGGIDYAGMEKLLGSENVIAAAASELEAAGGLGIEQVAANWSSAGANPINDGSGFYDKFSDGTLGAKFDSNRLFA